MYSTKMVVVYSERGSRDPESERASERAREREIQRERVRDSRVAMTLCFVEVSGTEAMGGGEYIQEKDGGEVTKLNVELRVHYCS